MVHRANAEFVGLIYFVFEGSGGLGLNGGGAIGPAGCDFRTRNPAGLIAPPPKANTSGRPAEIVRFGRKAVGFLDRISAALPRNRIGYITYIFISTHPSVS